eukprot:TRINITY_DN811_c0_g3_i1.p1 TRINITY_DN811_c0_g3~~TRINITY_DN811_c0_g3_i1.p1  ORF type:complete len:221 (+),score=32.90 TRINITY_DN811_c0_g3_i1:137-799(+)
MMRVCLVWRIGRFHLGSDERKTKKQEWLITPSTPLTHLYQLLKSACTLHNSQKEPIGTLPEGSLYGAECFFARTVCSEGVRAGPEGRVRAIRVAWMDKLFASTPLLAARVVKYLGVCLEMRLRAMLMPPAAAAAAAPMGGGGGGGGGRGRGRGRGRGGGGGGGDNRPRVTAQWPYETTQPDELPFAAGETLIVVGDDGSDWIQCQNAQGRTGYVPRNYTQ